MIKTFMDTDFLAMAKSQEKRKQIWDILKTRSKGDRPNERQKFRHRQLWMVGFLKKVLGFSEFRILGLIDYYQEWDFYKPESTRFEVHKFFKPVNEAGNSLRSLPDGEDGGVVGVEPNTHTHHSLHPSLDSLAELNQKFFENAENYAIEYESGKFKRHGIAPNDIIDMKTPVFRTVKCIVGSMLVLDIDSPDDIEKALRVTHRLMEKYEWDIVKFSGFKGFHLIKYIDTKLSKETLKQMATDRFNSIDNEGLELDPSMYRTNQIIRGYCFNYKSRQYSIPITKTDTLKDILKRSVIL